MGPLHEIVDAEAFGRFLLLLAVLGPPTGLGIGAVVGVRRSSSRKDALTGLLFGLVGTLIWLLWMLYNALTDANGLDTVRNLFLNLALFVGVGAAIGFGIGWVRLRGAASPTSVGDPSDTPQ